MTRSFKELRAKDADYETACSLAHGHFCGNCEPADGCEEHGCISLRDGIYEELKAARKQGATNSAVDHQS